MKTLITLFLVLIILISMNPIKASDEIKYEVFKRNPDLVIKDCNETYVYWEFNIRKFDPPLPVRVPALNHTIYINWTYWSYDYEAGLFFDMVAAKYNLTYSEWYDYYEYLAGVRKELYPLKEKLLAEKGDLGITLLGVMNNYNPIVVKVKIYKINDEKVNTVLEYIKPFVKKYNAIVLFIEDYFPPGIYDKLVETVDKFYLTPDGKDLGEGFKKYLKLVREYYNFTRPIEGFSYSPGIIKLPIPENATYNEEFVRKAVSIVREYTGCEVPLVVNFGRYKEIWIGPLPATPSPIDKLVSEILSFNNFILFIVIPTLLLTSLILISKKRNKK